MSDVHPQPAIALPKSESEFLALLNESLSRVVALTPADHLAACLESLELVIVWTVMDELGADLPPGIESTIVTVHELYEHLQLRRGAEGALR